jgi:hypothetical protein
MVPTASYGGTYHIYYDCYRCPITLDECACSKGLTITLYATSTTLATSIGRSIDRLIISYWLIGQPTAEMSRLRWKVTGPLPPLCIP